MAGWVEMGHFVFLIFSYFQKNENIALLHFKRKRKIIIYLNSHGHSMVYCFYCLNISEQK